MKVEDLAIRNALREFSQDYGDIFGWKFSSNTTTTDMDQLQEFFTTMKRVPQYKVDTFLFTFMH